jgi:alpha-beta hydrolase superfamily lysophospholipase
MDADTMSKTFKKWALVAAGLSAVAVALRKFGRSRRALDAGWVSEQWIAEHQMGPGSRVH